MLRAARGVILSLLCSPAFHDRREIKSEEIEGMRKEKAERERKTREREREKRALDPLAPSDLELRFITDMHLR